MFKELLNSLFATKQEASDSSIVLTDERAEFKHLDDLKALVTEDAYQKIFNKLSPDLTTAAGLQKQFENAKEFPATVAFVRRGAPIMNANGVPRRSIEITGVWVDESGNLVDRPPHRTIIG
jgi:hypothetical protein